MNSPSELIGFLNNFTNEVSTSLYGSKCDLFVLPKNIMEAVEKEINPQDKVISYSAEQLREQCIQEIYKNIKILIYAHMYECKVTHILKTKNKKIMEEVKRRLEKEGYEVNYRVDENGKIIMNIEW